MKRTQLYSQIQESVPMVLPQVSFKASISKFLFLSCIVFGIIKVKYSPFNQGIIQQPIMSINKVITTMTEISDPPALVFYCNNMFISFHCHCHGAYVRQALMFAQNCQMLFAFSKCYFRYVNMPNFDRFIFLVLLVRLSINALYQLKH